MRLLRAAGEARHGETDELESTARTLTLEWIVEACTAPSASHGSACDESGPIRTVTRWVLETLLG